MFPLYIVNVTVFIYHWWMSLAWIVDRVIQGHGCTAGYKSYDPFFQKKYMEAGVMTFVAHCTLNKENLPFRCNKSHITGLKKFNS